MTAIRRKANYLTLAGWIVFLGAFLMWVPDDAYGPPWYYFHEHGAPILQGGGFGMGLCLTAIGVLQLLVLWRNTTHFLALLFFLSGFVLWTSGILLGFECWFDDDWQGVVTVPFMLTLGGHKFFLMAQLMAERRTSE